MTVTATRTVTVQSVSAAAPFSVTEPTLPVTLKAGDSLTVAARFAPTTPGVQSGTLDLGTDAGTFSFDLHGRATAPGLGATPSSLDFGDVPTTGTVTQSVSVTNTSTVSESISATSAPVKPFKVTGMPAVGSTLAPGASVSVQVSFTPKSAASYSSALTVTSNRGGTTVPITGNGVSGFADLSITPGSVSYPNTRVGQTRTRTFDLTNTGNLVLTINKAAPPAAPFVTADPVSEGQQLAPGQVIHVSVAFSPTATGKFSGTYQITADDGHGAHALTFSGRAVKALAAVPPPTTSGAWQYNGSAAQQGDDTYLTDTGESEAGDAVYPTAVATDGLKVSFTAELGGGTGADGMAFDLLDPTTSTPSSLGNSGGALGFAGLQGIGIGLDTYQNDGDPSANFVGIAVSDANSRTDQMPYVRTHNLPSSLDSGTHTVTVSVGSGKITAVIDGSTTISARATIPPTAYVAFSGGTGGLTDNHIVRDVSIGVAP